MAGKRRDADEAELHQSAPEEEEERAQPSPLLAIPHPLHPPEQADEQGRRVATSTTALVVLAVLAVLAVIYYAKLPIIVLLISILLSFILAPLVDLLQRVRIPRAFSSLVAVLAFVGVLFFIGNVSYNKAVAFSHDLPKYSGKIRSVLGSLRRQAQQIQKTTQDVLPEDEQPKAGTTQTVTVQHERSWTDFTSGLGPLTEIIFTMSFIPFLTYFMLSWQDHVRSATVMLFRMKNRNTAYVTLGLISSMIRSFIVGNLLVGLFIGAASTVVFGILQLPYFYFIGFISGFLSLVPYLGVVVAVVPPLLSGLGQVHSSGLAVIIMSVLGLHLFALNVLYPKFLGSRLQLNPLAVTLSLLFWGWMWGAMGLVLAIPITAAIKIVFDHVEPMRGYGAWLGE
jgi:predicted PurR-regulated permease PerM